MKIALAQVNSIIGDLEGNVERCLAAVAVARAQGADLVVLPEMAIPGYPPRDILFDASFTGAIEAATADLAHCVAEGPPVVVGTALPGGMAAPEHPGLFNAAVLLRGGEITLVAAKRLLPSYDVFYEARWFAPGAALPPFSIGGRQVGFIVCEDLWDEGYVLHPPADLLAAGADLLICIAASPFRQGVLTQRFHHARRPHCPLVYVNLVGANDELIFDGRSFVLDGEGRLLAQLSAFEPAVQVVEFASASLSPPSTPVPEATLFQALVLGIRDFVVKNRLGRVTLGLSGGVDSAVVAVLAAEAVGAANVTALAIPSRYTDPRSTECARELATALGIGFEVVGLEPMHAAVEATLGDWLGTGVGAENAQARLRLLVLMAYVNRYGGILLNTSNKTELALGYGTLYADLAGTLSPLGDLTKPEVYALAAWIQENRGAPIPAFILERPPSAELKPDQVDPFDYPKIAPLLEQLVRENRSNAALRRSEHKRWHMGVILKVSDKAFGTGRLIPITRL
ncbi:MAG: NAD(+) synthase [Anaerolineae bacterium]|nr:NAD(+) synthase [Anaerolineae bacterium]